MFLSRNYRLIVVPRKFDVLKTNICPRSEASRANMLLLRTSNFQGATIRPIVPRQRLYCLYCSPLNFPVAACLKTENDKNLFIKISNRYGELRCFILSVVSSSDDSTSGAIINMAPDYIYTCINNLICQLLTSKEETFQRGKTSNLETSAPA